MSTTPEALYRATAAGIACGGRDILESFTGAGVPVDRIVATGGLPHAAPDLIQTFADVSIRFFVVECYFRPQLYCHHC